MWVYNSRTGLLLNNGSTYGEGYSGIQQGLNDPDYEAVHDIGPIPRGFWMIGDFFDDPGGKGPVVCHLTPRSDTETFGRSGFMIHGDNRALNHTASHGCIILGPYARNKIATSEDTDLQVV
jgi:hypothetical protein